MVSLSLNVNFGCQEQCASGRRYVVCIGLGRRWFKPGALRLVQKALVLARHFLGWRHLVLEEIRLAFLINFDGSRTLTTGDMRPHPLKQVCSSDGCIATLRARLAAAVSKSCRAEQIFASFLSAPGKSFLRLARSFCIQPSSFQSASSNLLWRPTGFQERSLVLAFDRSVKANNIHHRPGKVQRNIANGRTCSRHPSSLNALRRWEMLWFRLSRLPVSGQSVWATVSFPAV